MTADNPPTIDAPWCEEHKRTKHYEPMILANGAQLQVWICPSCESETDANFDAFLDRVRTGDFDDR